MALQRIQGSVELARKIKLRRIELNLTIEEAASRAGVGTKTWSRYEAGESIRRDKCKGICKALNWHNFPDDESNIKAKSLIEEYRHHEAWSQFLADNYGIGAAIAFAAGSDILLDFINQDLTDLAVMPANSHIGQLNTSFISAELPSQFLMRYNYDFLYLMKCVLLQLRRRANQGMEMTAHSVLEELIIYLCNKETLALVEIGSIAADEEFENLDDWVFEMFDDADIITFLYSNVYLTEDNSFHFNHWNDQQSYMN